MCSSLYYHRLTLLSTGQSRIKKRETPDPTPEKDHWRPDKKTTDGPGLSSLGARDRNLVSTKRTEFQDIYTAATV